MGKKKEKKKNTFGSRYKPLKNLNSESCSVNKHSELTINLLTIISRTQPLYTILLQDFSLPVTVLIFLYFLNSNQSDFSLG